MHRAQNRMAEAGEVDRELTLEINKDCYVRFLSMQNGYLPPLPLPLLLPLPPFPFPFFFSACRF